MYCQKHENDGVPKAEARFLNLGVYFSISICFPKCHIVKPTPYPYSI